MAKFRKKPVVIDAMQYDGTYESSEAVFAWAYSFGAPVPQMNTRPVNHDHIEIHTLEGAMLAVAGDWIIRGVKGEFYPCKPDIFEATYEPVADEGRGGPR